MAIRRYVAQNLITGLQPPRRLPSGYMQPHLVREGEIVELEEALAAPLVAGGSLVAHTGPLTAALIRAGFKRFEPQPPPSPSPSPQVSTEGEQDAVDIDLDPPEQLR